MNILIVSSYLPYPLTNGGNIRLFNLIKLLSSQHAITLVCEIRSYQDKSDIAEVEKYCKKIKVVKRAKQWSIKNILKAGLSTNSFLVTGHTNKELRNTIIQELNHDQFDLIHVETFYVVQNIPETRIPLIVVEHNIEYKIYERYVNNTFLLLRPILYWDIFKLKINEKSAWIRAKEVITVSAADRKEINRSNIHVVPNGVDLEKFKFKKPILKKYSSLARHVTLPEKEILFIGDFKWIQNRDSIRWIISDIWPFLLRAVEDEIKIKLRVVGKSIPDSIRSLSIYDSIIFDENAPVTTSEIFRNADILLSPTVIRGGTSFKILEAMATGIPVVTTSLGIEGLGAKDGKEVMVGNDTQTIVEKTARLLRDEELYTAIAANSRKLIEKEYSWDMIVKKLNEVYNNLIINHKS